MNLFEISKDLQSIYAEIEDNGGEITPELEEQLSITEDEFKSKIDSYCGLIKSIKGEIETVKLEQKRLTEYKNRKEILLDKLSNIVAEAVSKYGTETKTGGHNFDTGLNKVSVRNTKRCEVSETSIDMFATAMNGFIHRMTENGCLGELDFKDDFLKSKQGSEFTPGDLQAIKFKCTFVGTCDEMTQGKFNELLKVMPKVMNGVITYDASKTDCSNTINSGKQISIASISDNKSITIK